MKNDVVTFEHAPAPSFGQASDARCGVPSAPGSAANTGVMAHVADFRLTGSHMLGESPRTALARLANAERRGNPHQERGTLGACAADLAHLLADRKMVSEDLAAAGVDLAVAQRNLSAARSSLSKAQQDHDTALSCLNKRLQVDSVERVYAILLSVLRCIWVPTWRRLVL